MRTRTRIILLLLAVALILTGSVLYQQQSKSPALSEPKLADGPKIDTTPPKPLLKPVLADIEGKVRRGMTESEVLTVLGSGYEESRHAKTGNPVWRYAAGDGAYVQIEWEAPNRSGLVEAVQNGVTRTLNIPY